MTDLRAEERADKLAAWWEAGRHADATEIVDWLTTTDHPATIDDITRWDQWDWRIIGDETGLPTPPATQSLVITMLRERAS